LPRPIGWRTGIDAWRRQHRRRSCVGQQARETQRRPDDAVIGGERHDERGQARANDDEAVDQPDQPAERENDGEHDPRIDAVMIGADGEDDRGRANHRADRQIEFARDHQQADR